MDVSAVLDDDVLLKTVDEAPELPFDGRARNHLVRERSRGFRNQNQQGHSQNVRIIPFFTIPKAIKCANERTSMQLSTYMDRCTEVVHLKLVGHFAERPQRVLLLRLLKSKCFGRLFACLNTHKADVTSINGKNKLQDLYLLNEAK